MAQRDSAKDVRNFDALTAKIAVELQAGAPFGNRNAAKEASEQSEEADELSKAADKSGTSHDHYKAAEAHDYAADSHEAAADEVRDEKTRQMHLDKAQEHRDERDSHEKAAGRTLPHHTEHEPVSLRDQADKASSKANNAYYGNGKALKDITPEEHTKIASLNREAAAKYKAAHSEAKALGNKSTARLMWQKMSDHNANAAVHEDWAKHGVS